MWYSVQISGAAVENQSHDVQKQTVAAIYWLQLENRGDIMRAECSWAERGTRREMICLISPLPDQWHRVELLRGHEEITQSCIWISCVYFSLQSNYKFKIEFIQSVCHRKQPNSLMLLLFVASLNLCTYQRSCTITLRLINFFLICHM